MLRMIELFERHNIESGHRSTKAFQVKFVQRLDSNLLFDLAQCFPIDQTCPPLASAQRRAARLVTLPIAP
jgi:hypothetical protein